MSTRAEQLVAQEIARATPRLIEVLEVAELRKRVALAGPASWLIEGLWPADAYGVLGAEDKAGKSWAMLDLAVSVVTGTPWLGQFGTEPGPVLAYLGEGGGRITLRRLAAIVGARGGDLDDLTGLRLALTVPRLNIAAHLEEVRTEIAEYRPRLVVLDPLYLAAAGAKGSDLYAMGDVLGGLQHVCQQAGAALALATHWNKGGTGNGPERFTGVGPGAWGRVLGSAAVERRVTNPDRSTDVHLRWEFRGSEIGDRIFRMKRHVGAKDPDDLDSPLAYEVEISEEQAGAAGDELSRSQARVHAALKATRGPAGIKQIGDSVAQDGQGPPLKARTIQTALAELFRLGLVDGSEPEPGLARLWEAS